MRLIRLLALAVFLVAVCGVATAATNITSCQTISSPGYYVLNTSIIDASGTCIQITSSDVVFDGAGFLIDGTGSNNGIYVYSNSRVLDNVTIKNVNLTDWYRGIYFKNIDNSSIENVISDSNYVGIYMDNVNNTSVINNLIKNNGDVGLYAQNSNNLTIRNNTLTSNKEGIDFRSSHNSIIENNTVTSNWDQYYAGIVLVSSDNNTAINNYIANNNADGVYVTGKNNTIANNTLTLNKGAIEIAGDNNTIANNTVFNNSNFGIYVRANNNLIYNNFFNNTNNVYSQLWGSNFWNTSLTSGKNIIGGNYIGGNAWLKPDGTGFSQTCSDGDGDGICDSAYSLDANNIDYLPLVYDKEPPEVTVISPVNKAYGTSRVQINVSVTDRSPLSTVTAEIDGSTNVTLSLNNGYYIGTTPALSDGQHYIRIYAKDTYGNMNSSVLVYFSVDTTPPALSFVAPTPTNNSHLNKSYTEINGSIEEPNLDTFIFNWNGTNYSIYDDSLVLMLNFDNNSAIGENDTQVVDVSKYHHIGVINGATYISGKYGKALSFDGSNDYVDFGNKPEFQITQNITIAAWVKHNTGSPGSWEDIIMKGNTAYGFQFYSTQGYFTFHLTGAGGLGDWKNLASNVKPVAGVWYHVVGTYDGKTQRIYINGVLNNEINDTFTINTNNDPLTIGYKVASDNSYLNGVVDDVRIYNRALTPEEVKMLYYSTFWKYNSTHWYFYANITNLSDGIYTYTTWANDTAGNGNAGETRFVTIDTTPPVTTDDSPAGWQTKAFAVNLTCSDALSGCNVTYYRVDGSSWNAGNTVNISTDGNHTIEYYSVDNAGNVEAMKTAYAALDSTPPIVTLISPQNTTYSTSTIAINVSAFDPSSIDSVIAQIDGSINITLSLNNSYYVGTTPALSDGQHSLRIYAYDTLGNMNSSVVVYFSVDTTPPSVTIISPQNATYANSTVQINVSASDPSGVNTVISQIDGSANVTLNLSGGYYVGTTPALSDGPHSIRIYANDTYGNMNSSAVVYFSVDTVPPQISVTAPSPVYRNTFANLTVTITDVHPFSYSVYRNGSLVASGSYTGLSINVPINTSAIGNWNYTIQANDSAGNTNSTSVMVQVINNPPVASFTVSKTSARTYETLTFNGSSSHDPDGSIVNYTWNFGDGSTAVGVTATHSYSSAGTYTVTLIVTDNDGATDSESKQITITSPPLPSPPVAGAPVETFIPPPLEAPSEFEHIAAKLVSDEGAVFELSESAAEKTGVEEIIIKPEKTMTVAIAVSKVKSLPEIIPPPPYETYKIFEVSIAKYGTKIKVAPEGRIKFKVSKNWLEEKGYSKETITLMKYTEQWIEIPPAITGEDENYVYFEARVESFSIFAIVAKPISKAEAVPTVSPTATPTPTPAPTPEKLVTPLTPAPAVTETVAPAPTAPKPGIPGFLAVYALLALLATASVMRKSRR